MLLVTLIPLTVMAETNAMQYRKNIQAERITPMLVILSGEIPKIYPDRGQLQQVFLT